jgi:PAS domain S-box-containing protein
MRKLWKPLSIVAGLLLLLTYLWVQSRTSDLALRARMQEGLQALQLHDAELTRDVLLVRAGLLAHYDSLAATGEKLSGVLKTLRQESASASGRMAGTIGAHVDDLAEALQQKLILVEYFKSDNAVLRNSSTYFAYAGQRLGVRVGVEATVAAEVATLSHAMLRFMQTPEPSARQDTADALTRLAPLAASRRDLQALAAHGALILDVLPEVDALLRRIVAAPTATRAAALEDAVLQYSTRVEARAQVFRLLLYLVAIVLLGYLVYQFVRLQAGARALRGAYTDLQHEIAERRQAAAALRASEERFRAITESANDAIISADGSGRIVSWNARAEAIFGYHADEVLGAPLTRLIPPRYHSTHWQRFAEWSASGQSALAGKTVEFAGVRKDGSEFPLEISLSTWSTAQGKYVTGMVRDLTARKQLEETTRQQELQLIQANKMTALGTLVSGVAHEINNPNQLVLTSSKVVADAWDDALPVLDAHGKTAGHFTLSGLPYGEMRDTISTLVRDMHDSARRIERIIADLRDFVRPPASRASGLFQVNDAVQRALRLLAHLIRKRTQHLHVDLSSDVPALPGDAQHVEQVVVNLLTNALEALPDRNRGVLIATALDVGDRSVVLAVRDEGVGIPKEHLARLCDPFFTTKQDSGGTGLGLAITASLVRELGGRLTFSSELGQGTSARVRFPAHPEQPVTAGRTGASAE